MNKDRIRLAIKVMERVRDQQLPFNMNVWVKKAKCGTAACFAGHLALSPEFQALGLGLVEEKDEDDVVLKTPRYKGEIGWRAIKNLLDISSPTTSMLVYPYSYHPKIPWGEPITPQHVIDRLNRLLNEGEEALVPCTENE